MAETIKLWHFNTLTAYNDANVLGKINYQDISFVKDKTIIITNGATYSGVDLLENSTAIFSKILEGNLINVFDSIQEASQKLDIDKRQIINALALKKPVEDCYFLPATLNIFDVIEWRKSKNGGRKIIYR